MVLFIYSLYTCSASNYLSQKDTIKPYSLQDTLTPSLPHPAHKVGCIPDYLVPGISLYYTHEIPEYSTTGTSLQPPRILVSPRGVTILT